MTPIRVYVSISDLNITFDCLGRSPFFNTQNDLSPRFTVHCCQITLLFFYEVNIYYIIH